ncbi:MAG: hydrogen gas-evolving membrane-bound hydrogenase subunit E [Anaerolineales bacterium]
MDILFINALPFFVAALLAIPDVRRLFGKSIQTWFTAGVMALLFAVLLGYFPEIRDNGPVERTVTWMPELGLSFSFYLDGLSLLFGLVVTGVGTAIYLYSGYYFDDELTQSRFNMLLMLFTGAMLGLVLSGNLITMFIMWELTSITSFLLIGFKGDKYESARFGASQALVITGAGGLALLAGVLLISVATGQILEPDSATPFMPELSAVLQADLTNHPWYNAMAILVMLGAFTKSAQFPFHFWLPGGMSAPTPASAFLHSATMVKAGVYLLARMYPTMGNTDLWETGLLGVGLVTMFIASFFSIKQRDLKGLLAYTTITKLGMLVFLIGLPDYIGYKAAMVGILAHALYKAALFLCVGSIDHAFETRIIDKLGGVAKYMPWTAGIATISALSMAGVPFFFGFVAKEVLIAASMDAAQATLFTAIITATAVFTATAGFILIWDVFFRKPDHKLHYHAMTPAINFGPVGLVAGTISLGFLLDPLIIPLLETIVPKAFELKLWPGFITEFYISIGAIIGGLALFAVRGVWLPLFGDLPFDGTRVYTAIMGFVDWSGDQLLRSQSGKLRYYLISILGVLAFIILGSGLLVDLANSAQIFPDGLPDLDVGNTLDGLFLVLAIGAALASVVVKRQLMAVLSVSITGYAVAGIFLVEQAPDVAFVQFMVETLATVLLIIILSRTSPVLQKQAADRLWTGSNGSRIGIYRDALIAGVIGTTVGIFALIAVTNRPERESISQWHIDNAEPLVEVPDVVSAILTDFRGMDTFVEIAVFAMAALGILALYSIYYGDKDSAAAHDAGPLTEANIPPERATLSTPFTRVLASFILPFALVIVAVHVFYGAKAPGDGFTAGVIGGLSVGLWYMVYGYTEARRRLRWFYPVRMMSLGLLVAITNAAAPILFDGTFMGLRILDEFEWAELKLSTTLFFEIGIALTVFGSVGVMLEAIARPREAETLRAGDTDYSQLSIDDGRYVDQELQAMSSIYTTQELVETPER